VATQALEPGQRQAGAAYQHLRKWYAPPVIAIVGIAGGIHPDVEPGDVVIATRIVYYDSRREDPDQTRLRGESHDPPPATQHAINAFFSWWGEPAVLRRRDRGRPVVFRAVPGLIGSGEAVVRGRNHQAGGLPHRYQDKILAIETEGAGLAHAFHEDRDAQAPPRGWVVVRGISDKANRGRDDAYHADASHNAAHVFAMLVPYLISREGG
jgi:adenosylhomocysteine nucleosidase